MGWRVAYLVSVAAPGELPASWRAWKTQQYRWTKGTAQATLRTMRGILPRLAWWRRGLLIALAAGDALLPIVAVLAIAAGFAHLAAGGRLFDPTLAAAIWATIGVHVAARIAGVLLSRQSLGDAARGGLIGDLGAALAFEISVTAERIRATTSALMGRRSGFVRTEKRGR